MCVALDLSRSMYAEDLSPNRLKQAKNQIALFLKNLTGDRVSIVGFAGSGYVAAPLSIDYPSLLDFMEPMNPEFISDQSTNLAAGVDSCLDALEIRDEKKSEDLVGEAAKVIVLVSDGEDNVEDYKDALVRVNQLKIPVYAVAMGTIKGAPIPLRSDDSTLQGYLKDPETGQPVMSMLKDKALKEIASRTNADVFYSSEGVGAWVRLEKALKKYQRNVKEMGAVLNRVHRFPIFLILAFVFLILDFFIPEVKMKWKYFPFFLVFFYFPQIHSYDMDPRSVWKNNKGVKSFEKKNFNQAESDFAEAMAIGDQHQATYLFNWASNRLNALWEKKIKGQTIKEEDISNIKKTYENLEKNLTDPLQKKVIQHQLAQTWELLDKNNEALEHYYKSLNIGGKSTQLDAASKINIQRLLHQNQSQSESSKGEGGGDGKQGNDSKNPSNGDKSDSKNDKKSENKAHQKPKYTGTDLSEEQAKQIMQSVSTEEKEVQKRKAKAESKQQFNEKNQKGKNEEGGRQKPW
jgi:Ca-activated chloride channel family protein